MEFTYYKVGKPLLQTKQVLQYEATLVQIGAGITKLGKHYYKVRLKLLQNGADNLLQSGAIVNTKWGSYYKVGQIYYIVG